MATEKPWWEKAWDWAVSGEDTPPTPYVDPRTKKAVTNVQPTGPSGRRTQANPETSWTEFFANIKNNWGLGKMAEAARGAVRGIKDIPKAPEFFGAAARGFRAESMTPDQYYRAFLRGNRKFEGMASLKPGSRPSDAVIRQQMQRDLQAANMLANAFSYRDAKGNLQIDTEGMWRSASQDPVGVLAAVATGGEGAAAKLGAKVGKFGAAAQAGSRTARAANIVQKGLKVAETGAKGAKVVLNPLIPATSAVLKSQPVRSAATATINAVRGRQSIYRPEFLREWTPFREAAEARLRANGVGDDVIGSPEAQQRIYDMFTQQTNGRFANPFTDNVTEAMRAKNLRPEAYAAPHIGKHIEDTVNLKRGVSPDIIREGALRAAGARNVTRSTATGEAPGLIFGRQEGTARASTEAQMGESLSGRFAPPAGTTAPGLGDLTDDFINTQVQRRNAFGRSYDDAARHDGVYSDPNSFVANLDQEAANLLRQRGIDPTELQSNADVFRGANTATSNLRRNIGNHGASLPAIEESVGGIRYSYDRQYNIWLDQSGSPAPNLVQRALNADPTIQARISAPAPQPVNRLSLENIEIERRRLNGAAERAYQQGVQTGDFREYQAITAYRDALDNTSINMANTFTGDARAAIPSLQQGRAQYQEWRSTGIDSPNPVVRDAAQRVMQRTDADPASGAYRFNDTAGGRAAVADAFEGKLVGSDGVAPPASIGSGAATTNPAETYTALSRSLSPAGQDTLRGYIRSEGYGRPGAAPEQIERLDRMYASNGIDLLTPEERNFLNINIEGRYATSPQAIPQRDPFNFNPFAEAAAEEGALDKAAKIAGPFVKGGIGYGIGTTLGGPGLGMAFSGMGALEDPLMRGVKQIGLFRNEQAGAPKFSVNIPDTQLPVAAGMAYGSQQAQESGRQRLRMEDEAALKAMAPVTAPMPAEMSAMLPQAQQEAQPAPKPQPRFSTENEDALFLKTMQPSTQEEDAAFFGQPEGRWTGGRAAYKSGGAVNDIEPLVRNLMNRAKHAKKLTNKDTEALLNSHDDAIASALEVAQKSI